jgi:uncharacterized protein (TIGR02231 family)
MKNIRIFSLSLLVVLLFTVYFFAQESQDLAKVVVANAAATNNTEVVAKSTIISVTIYPDRATIIREASLRLSPETRAVVFSRLPSTLISNSLRVTGKGTANVKILGIDVSSEYLESPLLPEIKKLQAEIDGLGLEISKTKNSLDVLESQEKFLNSIQSATVSKASQDVALGKPDVLAWEKVLEFLGTKLQSIKQSKLEHQKVLNEQEAKLDAFKKKLNSIKPQRPLEGRKVTVNLEPIQAGDFELSLSYTVYGVHWLPLYTMRALPDSSEIEFTMTAAIFQKSGEDWDEVKALLSTSSPVVETNPGKLSPWIVDLYIPPPMRREKVAEGMVGGVMGGVVSEKEAALPEAPAEAAVEMKNAEIVSAGIIESGLHLNFDIRRDIKIPSDGEPHKIPIDSQKIKVKYDYIAIPRLKEAAFLRGNLKNSLGYPLLPGDADLFIIQDFVGSTQLPQIAIDEEAKMFFGEDRQIKVKYEQVKREKSGAGFLGKTEKLKLVYRITAQNLRKDPVTMDILDQLPLSQNTKIEVKDVKILPEPPKKDEKGILTWSLTLAPQEKKEILIDFTVEYPKDANIIGL